MIINSKYFVFVMRDFDDDFVCLITIEVQLVHETHILGVRSIFQVCSFVVSSELRRRSRTV